MTRRITMTMLTLTIALLVVAVVPLGLAMAQREHIAFRDKQQAATQMIATAAEEYLSDHHSADLMLRKLAAAQHAGDCVAVYDASGRLVAGTHCMAAQAKATDKLVAATLRGYGPEAVSAAAKALQAEDRLLTAEPVGDGSQLSGAVVLARSAKPLRNRIAAVWYWFSLIGLIGLAASVLLSVRLARWVGRPLSALDTAAQRLGEGALGERTSTDSGPPEVRRLATTFNAMAARTEALVHGHQAVVADVSHQLRTPLAALRLRLDLLAAGADEYTVAELFGAQEEIARLSRLVDGMLAVARAEQTVPRPEPVRVDQVVAERVAAWEPVAHERDVLLTAPLCPPLTAALGAGLLEQMLDNLLANALDAVPGGGWIGVEAKAVTAQNTVRIRVVDNGPGMDAEAKAAAFRRFGNPQARGTGLGLAIVHRLVTANGGGIKLVDTLGGGLTAVLDLPLWRRGRDHMAAVGTRTASSASSGSGGPGGSGGGEERP